MAIRWGLRLDTSGHSTSLFCLIVPLIRILLVTMLWPAGTGRCGGTPQSLCGMRYLNLSCHVNLNVSLEKRHGLTRDPDHTRPGDILIAGWDRGKPAALDITIASPLCPAILGELYHQAGAADLETEACKLHSKGPKSQALGWSCIPLNYNIF